MPERTQQGPELTASRFRRLRTRKLDQGVTQSYPFLEAAERFRLLVNDAKGGLHLANAQDAKSEALVEQFRRTTEPKAAQRRAEAGLRYIGENGTYFGLTSIPYFDALRGDVKGFRFRRHLKLDFETVWLDR